LDDLDLLVASAVQDDVELVLLVFLGGRSLTAARGGHSGDRRLGAHVKGLFELLDELGELQQRHCLEDIEQLVVAHLGHEWGSFRSVPAHGHYPAVRMAVTAITGPPSCSTTWTQDSCLSLSAPDR